MVKIFVFILEMARQNLEMMPGTCGTGDVYLRFNVFSNGNLDMLQ